tara:strand:- start:722 stop:1294 length:573 start_codon:yes stop_codon:yes gene_type:complete
MHKFWIPGSGQLHESVEAHGAAGSPNPLVTLDPGLFIWTILTFLILFFLLKKFAWTPLLQALQLREEEIKSSLQDAEKARNELINLNDESEKILIKARSEAQQIRSEAKSSAEKIRTDIRSKAEEESKRILEDAQNQIQVEKGKAISEIREEVVTLSMLVAEKVIGKNLSIDDNDQLIKHSLEKLRDYEA